MSIAKGGLRPWQGDALCSVDVVGVGRSDEERLLQPISVRYLSGDLIIRENRRANQIARINVTWD